MAKKCHLRAQVPINNLESMAAKRLPPAVVGHLYKLTLREFTDAGAQN